MKIVDRNILPFQKDDFFTPLRDKSSFARLIVLSARKLLLKSTASTGDSAGRLKLIIDKMSRLFFYQTDKYYSIAFPLTVIIENEDEVAEIRTYSGQQVDSYTISLALSVLNNTRYKSNQSLIECYLEENSEEWPGINLLEEIFLFEPSYLRYDYDSENENGRLHPLNHIDINYSQSGTFKLGLQNRITPDSFENLLDIRTDCSSLIDI